MVASNVVPHRWNAKPLNNATSMPNHAKPPRYLFIVFGHFRVSFKRRSAFGTDFSACRFAYGLELFTRCSVFDTELLPQRFVYGSTTHNIGPDNWLQARSMAFKIHRLLWPSTIFRTMHCAQPHQPQLTGQPLNAPSHENSAHNRIHYRTQPHLQSRTDSFTIAHNHIHHTAQPRPPSSTAASANVLSCI